MTKLVQGDDPLAERGAARNHQHPDRFHVAVTCLQSPSGNSGQRGPRVAVGNEADDCLVQLTPA